jgi:hypothetical protein
MRLRKPRPFGGARILLAGTTLVVTGACGGEVLPLQGNPPGSSASAGASASAGIGGSAGALAGRGGGGPDAGTGGLGEGGSGEPPVTPGTTMVGLEGSPIYTRVQRLTLPQWERAVTDILAFQAPANLSRGFTLPLAGSTDFTNNEKLLFVDRQVVLEFELGAEAAAALATESPEAIARIDAGTEPEDFIRTLGRRVFRRPLTPDEETRYQAIFTLGETIYGEGFENGAALLIRALLQSPHFLYRSELGAGGYPLTGYEIASKLSFWLLGTTPSDALLEAAEAGELDSVEGVELAARSMLEDPAAVGVMRDFHTELHHLDRYAEVVKLDAPEYTSEMNAELLQASQAFFDSIFARGQGLREILTTSQAFAGPALASLYGIAPPSAGLDETTLDASRTGYFMQAPFLLLHSSTRTPDPLGRGIALARDALCLTLSPSNMEAPAPPPLAAGQTNRERIEATTGPCGGACHSQFEPLGFALEDFDGMGAARSEDNGEPIDTAASFAFADGIAEFADGLELMRVLADGTHAHTCYAKKLAGYALQRDIVAADLPLLETLSEVSREDSLKAMALRLVKEPAFRTREEEAP